MDQNNPPTLSVLAHNIRSLYNVGSLFRLADGLGVDQLYLTGYTGTPATSLKNARQRQQIAKTALEGLDSVNWQYHPDPVILLQELQQQRVNIIGLELTPNSQPLNQFTCQGPTCLILGHERDGVSPELLQYCQQAVHIPMKGQGKSLNVSTAAAIALHHLSQQLKP